MPHAILVYRVSDLKQPNTEISTEPVPNMPAVNECWRETARNSRRNHQKLPASALRGHPMGKAITSPKRRQSGQLWVRGGPVFTHPPPKNLKHVPQGAFLVASFIIVEVQFAASCNAFVDKCA